MKDIRNIRFADSIWPEAYRVSSTPIPMSARSVATNAENAILSALSQQAPNLSTFENAALAMYHPSQPGPGLRQLLDASGTPVAIDTPSGVVASAFVDMQGNLIVSFQGTTTDQQSQMDLAIMEQTPASRLPAFADAVSFYQHALSIANAQGLGLVQGYTTGFSLGATLASYVASQTGAGGVAFASSGVPGYQAPATPAANFVTVVDAGDPWANYSTDSAEHGIAGVGGYHMDHYGSVLRIGSAADAAQMQPLVNFSDLAAQNGVSLAELESGQAQLPGVSLQDGLNMFWQLFGEFHNVGVYMPLATAAGLPSSAYALSDTSLSSIVSSVVHDLPAIEKELPKLLHATSLQQAETSFQHALPDLATELVQLTHASSFGAAVGKALEAVPGLAPELSNPKALGQVAEDLMGDVMRYGGVGSGGHGHVYGGPVHAPILPMGHHASLT